MSNVSMTNADTEPAGGSIKQLVPEIQLHLSHLKWTKRSSKKSSRKWRAYALTPCIGWPVLTVIEVNRHYMSYSKQKWITLQKIAYLHWILTWKQVLSVSSVVFKKQQFSRRIWLNLNINFISLSFSIYTCMCRDSNLLFCEIINWIIVLLISIWAFRNIRLGLSICRDLKLFRGEA